MPPPNDPVNLINRFLFLFSLSNRLQIGFLFQHGLQYYCRVNRREVRRFPFHFPVLMGLCPETHQLCLFPLVFPTCARDYQNAIETQCIPMCLWAWLADYVGSARGSDAVVFVGRVNASTDAIPEP